jgi:ankyrin repeat protein
MRLLLRNDTGDFSLKDLEGDDIIPPYAILSHTWKEGQEVTFKDLIDGTGKSKTGYDKIRFCGQQAERDDLQYFWVDTCCIDKSSSAELTEAINSMFRWYKDAARCYVYLSDVSVSGLAKDDESSPRWKSAFKRSRWFTRGWTLQELIAPTSVEFFSKEKQRLGDKQSLEQTLHEITGIAVQALRGRPLSHLSAKERISWAAKRQTKREEDKAYSLLGIFGIHMPLIYGEGQENALNRLQKEINEPLRDLLDSLRFDQIDARHMTIKNAYDKTCKWLLGKSEYLDWLDATKLGEHHGFLWIKGKPGTGKSTLMKFILANARETMKDRIIISFFFNARGEDLEKSAIGTYRSLLLQLLEQLLARQGVFALSTSSISTNHQWGVELLKTLLEQAIQKLGESSVVCFIDALDECEECQIRDMISFFEHVGKFTVSAGIKFRVCFSSRHYPHITIRKGLYLVLEGQHGHDQDIANYLESELKIGQSNIAKEIRTEIRDKASGVFMWVVLVVGILNKEHDGGRMHALQRRLQEIPSELHELFRDILTRDSHNRDELVLCIQWVLFSRQPLSPEELYFAILVGVEPEALSRWDPGKITRDIIKRFILSSSKGLAEITKSGTPKVQFIHESVKDFLLKENALGNIWPDLGSNFQGQSHNRLKHCCLSYINISISSHREFSNNLPKASLQEAVACRKLASGAFPFLEYAVRNVLFHADVAAGCGIAQENLIQSFPLDRWIKLDSRLKERKLHKYTKDASLLYVLAENNMSNLIRVHPSILSCLKVENERYGPPLFAALATGSKEAVRTFVEAYAATQSRGSLLHNLCSRYRHNEGSWDKFGRDLKLSSWRTLLSYLGELGDEVIFALGLETGNIMPNSKDQGGRTPLSWAAANGHEVVVRLLLDTGKVDVNSRDCDGLTPLSWAVENKHEAVVKLLLNTGKVNVNSRDCDGLTPLSWAVITGHEAVIKMLLDTGKVDVDSRDYEGQTLLWWAAANGHGTVVKMLLDTGKVDVDSRDCDGLTPLWWAAANGHETVVKLLLNTGKVDVNLKNPNGQTPLSWAARNRHETVIKLLLDTGKVNVDLRDCEGQTPLWWAAANGHEAVVKMLFNTGKVDVDSRDCDGLTPLWWAAANGHETVVKLLLNTGKVDVNSKDQYGRTPLLWAVENGHEAVVKLMWSHVSVSAH